MVPLTSLFTSVWSNELSRSVALFNQFFWLQTTYAWCSYMAGVDLGCKQLSLMTQKQNIVK